jgi:uncharacterized coiled-coil protein SlyX
MSYEEDLSDLHKRLDDLEQRLAAKEAEIAKRGAIPPHHQKHIDEIYAKARAARDKLGRCEESTWDSVKDEVEADWLDLTASFRHWVAHVDEDYRGLGS